MSKYLKPEDLDKVRLVSDPKLSPSGRYTVFTLTKPSIDENKYISELWLIDNESEIYDQLVGGEGGKFPEWFNDERHILYLASYEDEGRRWNEIRIVDLDRLSIRSVYKSKYPIMNLRVSSDDRSILFIENVNDADEDVMVIERIPIWFNGKGFTYKSRNIIKILDVFSGNIIELDLGGVDAQFAEYSRDGDKVYYVGTPDKEKPYLTSLYVHDLKSGDNVRLTMDDIRVLDFVQGPNDNIYFRGQDFSHGLSTHRKIYVSKGIGEYNLLTDIDLDIVNAINCDVRGPSSSRALQIDGNKVFFPLAIGGRVALYSVDSDGLVTPILEGDYTIENYSIKNGVITYTRHDPVNPPEVYLYKDGVEKKVTEFNEFLKREFSLAYPEKFSFRASDGANIDGWIMRPPFFDESQKYPAILYIHGGPATTFGYSFIFEFQTLVAQGFILIYTNPRGSTGYSQKFKDIRGHYGEREYLDLMEAVDYVTKNFEYIDGDRLGVTGGSYGGFMTNWIIGHTNRFKAAVTQRSISNWVSKFGTTDIGFYFNSDQIAGGLGRPYWEDEWFNIYWDKSPLKYVSNIKTPTLIIHSMEDYRCWVDQAIQLFTALKLRNVDTKLVLFPKENHDLSRTGKPRHRVERIKHIIQWFKDHL